MIALLGNLARDLKPGLPPQVGGGPFHGARALQRLRVPARIVVRCGADDRAALLPPIVRLGTPVRYVSAASTATFAIAYRGEQREMRLEALGDPWLPSDLPGLPPAVSWVHVAPLARTDFGADTLAALGRRRRLSLDGQGLVRVPETGPLTLDASFDPDLLRHVWTLKLADEEAEVIGDVTALPVRELLVTHGGRGATLYVGGRREEIPAHYMPGDPTGAGDAFMASYVAARSTGFGPVGAARRATAVVEALLAP